MSLALSPFSFSISHSLSTRSHFPIQPGTGLFRPPSRVWPGSGRRRLPPIPWPWAPPCRPCWGRVARHAGREKGSFHTAVRVGDPRTERMEGRGLEVDKGPLHWTEQLHRHAKSTQFERTVQPKSKLYIYIYFIYFFLKGNLESILIQIFSVQQ